MRKIFALLTVICAVSAMAETKTLWSCGFEAEEGYQTGKVIGQCGWYKATGTITTRDVVAKDPGEAASGDQYLSYDPSVTDKGKVTAVKFDISEDYVIAPYNQLRISWDQARISRDYRDDTCYVILHNFGETGRSADIEIARLRLENNYAGYTGTRADKSGQLNVTINMSNPDDWHHCCIILDPANRMVKEFTVDDVVIDACTDTYYKNESDSASSTRIPRGGELIDGIGVMNKGKYDNFKVELIPEPASLGLLALLGLFFVRKER